MKKYLILCLCLSVLLLSACTKPVEAPPRAEEPVSAQPKLQLPLRITWAEYSGRGEAIQKIIDVFNTQNQDIEVIVQGGNEDLNEISALMKSDAGKAVFVLPYRYVSYFGAQKSLLNLSAYFKQDEKLYYPNLWKLGTVEGNVYGIPWLGHSICLIYNKRLLAQAGVEAESINSMDDFVNALVQIESKTGVKGVGLVGANHNDISWMVNQFVYGFGSNLVDKGGKKVALNNEQAKNAITFYKDVLGAHAQESWKSDTGVEVLSHFLKQEVAFEFQGIWGVTDVQKNGDPFEVGVMNLNKIGLKSEVGPLMLAIPEGMEQAEQEAAIRLIQYLMSTEAQENIMNGEYSPEHDAYYPFRVPTRMDLVNSLVFEKNPAYVPFVEGFEHPSIDVPIPKWQTIKDSYYAPGLNKVMSGQISVDTFLEMVEQEGNKILNESK